MTDPAPKIGAVLETAIYVDDLSRAGRFYEETWAFDCGPGSVLLAFLRGATAETLHLPGGEIPPHEGMGRLHFALAIAAADLGAWEARLAGLGVAIEARMNWPRGGKSLYFRDPDHNLVELATPGLWANY
jgi:catechol 2,3-dioxygenase-like lactoylglutathione lyase family enzyme